ncbi:glucan biosynthesis protein [Shigella flexneri]
MKYADYRQIHFNHDKAYWNNIKTPFKLEFYHQGMYSTRRCHRMK